MNRHFKQYNIGCLQYNCWLFKKQYRQPQVASNIKNCLKKIKKPLCWSERSKSGESEWREPEVKENVENSVQAKETNGPSGEGREEQQQSSSEE